MVFLAQEIHNLQGKCAARDLWQGQFYQFEEAAQFNDSEPDIPSVKSILPCICAKA